MADSRILNGMEECVCFCNHFLMIANEGMTYAGVWDVLTDGFSPICHRSGLLSSLALQ